MVENRMSETEAGEIIREMHKKAEDLIIDILKVHANRIYEFIRVVEERAGGTPESALEYLGLHMTGLDKELMVERYATRKDTDHVG